MIKKPEELKKAFSNGSIPTQGDFGDLIDSFMPHDVISADDVAALREMALWWRNADRSGMAMTPPPGKDATVVDGLEPVATTLSAMPPMPPTAGVIDMLMAADGEWHVLPVITDKTGTWTCSVDTVHPRPGFKVSGTAIAVSGLGSPRLVQIMDPESLFSWRTLQFKWQKSADGAHSQLALRSRRDFGLDTTGKRTGIHCHIEFGANR